MQGISGSGRLKGSVGPIYVGILLLVAAMVHGASKTSCRNAQGKAVDWWIMLKKPKGSAYAYVDSTMASPAFQIVTDANLTKTSGNPLAETVGKIYSKSVWHVTYNDQLWNRTAPKFPLSAFPANQCGHAKGLLGFDANGGFWLTHSTPKFPNSPTFYDSYTGVDSCNEQETKCTVSGGQLKEGQSFFCVSLNASGIEDVAQTIITAAPIIYSSRLPPKAKTAFPKTQALVDDCAARKKGAEPTYGTWRQRKVVSAGGDPFVLFAKAPGGGSIAKALYLYEEIVEPYFKTDLRIQAWKQNGSFPSFCPEKGICPRDYCLHKNVIGSPYETRVISRIHLNKDFNWPTGDLADDHSKWVVSGTGVYPVAAPEPGPHGKWHRSPSSSHSPGPAVLLNRRRLITQVAGATSPSYSNSDGSPEYESNRGLADGGAGGPILPPAGPEEAPMGPAREAAVGRAGPDEEAGWPAIGEEVAGSPQVVCFGDVNRAQTQLQRGGGAICFTSNRKLWSIFDRIVAELLDCGEMP